MDRYGHGVTFHFVRCLDRNRVLSTREVRVQLKCIAFDSTKFAASLEFHFVSIPIDTISHWLDKIFEHVNFFGYLLRYLIFI